MAATQTQLKRLQTLVLVCYLTTCTSAASLSAFLVLLIIFIKTFVTFHSLLRPELWSLERLGCSVLLRAVSHVCIPCVLVAPLLKRELSSSFWS